MSAVGAGRRDWLTHDEVEKKPQQVWNEHSDQNPKNRLHSALPGVSVDVPEAEQPGCDEAAEKHTRSETTYYSEDCGTGVEVLPMLDGWPKKSDRQPDQCSADYKDDCTGANWFGNHTQKTLADHRVLSFRFAADNKGNIGNISKRQMDGAIQKANSP